MNLLGLDYGSKNIGIAIAYREGDSFIVVKHATLEMRQDLIKKISKIIKEESIIKIVVGLPIGFKGQETQQTKETLEFIDTLKSQISIPIEVEDERLTSELAKRISKKDIHQESAKIILESHLEKLKHAR